jgi:spoIIIJ-associated protein
MPWITKEGRTVEEAREAAVGAAGLPESELEIEVVNEGAKGLFGLGGEPAVVRVRPRAEAADVRAAFHDDITPPPGTAPARQDGGEGEDIDVAEATQPPEAAADEPPPDRMALSEQQAEAARIGAEIAGGILDRMNLSGDITTRVAGGTVYVEIFGDDMGILIGRGGATLEALQEVVRAGVQRRLHARQALVVDVEAYWERRRSRGRGRHPQEGNRRGGGRRGGNRRSGSREP